MARLPAWASRLLPTVEKKEISRRAKQPAMERASESSAQLVRIAGLWLGQRLAANTIDRGADLVGRGLCRRRLVLDYLHRMTLRRIHTEQGRTPLGNLEQKQPTHSRRRDPQGPCRERPAPAGRAQSTPGPAYDEETDRGQAQSD